MSSKPRIYIGRLSHRAREYDVEDFLKGYGRVRDIMLKNGFGFVEFEDFRDADDAVHDLNGNLVIILSIIIRKIFNCLSDFISYTYVKTGF